jgi:hypothetical protein
MPFDGVEAPLNYLAKFDQLIALIESPSVWVKHTYRTPNGRHCLKEALNAVGIAEIFESIILKVAEEVTGREFCCIESFNDHAQTSHGDVVAVLHQTRTSILDGKVVLPLAEMVTSIPSWSQCPTPKHGGWSGPVWRKLFCWS